MILVLLGTFHIEFPRPLIEIERLVKAGKLNEEVIVQNGYTNFASPYFTLKPFMQSEDLDKLYQDARLIITHAGTGSIIKGVKMGKKVIAIARLFKLGEHIDDHQLEILTEFVKMGYIFPWNENDSLEQVLTDIKDFKPNTYVSKKGDMISYLKKYIDNL